MSIAAQEITDAVDVDTTHSSFRFSVTHMGVATFSATFAEVDLDVEGGDGGLRIDGVARVESVTIRSPREFREHVVYGEDFLDARRYPEITFSCEDVELSDDGTATLNGELTIKGITKPFTAIGTYHPFVADPFGSQRAGFEVTAKVDRRDWGLDWQVPLPDGRPALGYTVELQAHVELVKPG